MTELDYRKDANPSEEGQFADPANKTYPIATEADIRSSWRYINNPDNTTQYKAEELETIKAHIQNAARQNAIDLSSEA